MWLFVSVFSLYRSQRGVPQVSTDPCESLKKDMHIYVTYIYIEYEDLTTKGE